MNKIKIVCDSLSDVTDQQIEKYDIEFIPLNIIIGDNEYKDRQNIVSFLCIFFKYPIKICVRSL